MQWKENGVDKSAEVDVGKTVVRELVFADGDVTKEVKFATKSRAKRKDNDDTVLLNGRKDVSFVVTTDRRSQSVVGTNMPRYIVAELRNEHAKGTLLRTEKRCCRTDRSAMEGERR